MDDSLGSSRLETTYILSHSLVGFPDKWHMLMPLITDFSTSAKPTSGEVWAHFSESRLQRRLTNWNETAEIPKHWATSEE